MSEQQTELKASAEATIERKEGGESPAEKKEKEFTEATKVKVEEPTLERKEMPEVVKENIRTEERVEVQPVIQRERETTEIRQVEQPRTRTEVLPEQVTKEKLPEHDIGVFKESEVKAEEQKRPPVESERTVEGLTRETVQKPAVVEEVVKPKVIEEVQPVLHKDTIEKHVVQKELPIKEKVVEAPTYVHEVRPVKEEGVIEVKESGGQDTRGEAIKKGVIEQQTVEAGPEVGQKKEVLTGEYEKGKHYQEKELAQHEVQKEVGAAEAH